MRNLIQYNVSFDSCILPFNFSGFHVVFSVIDIASHGSLSSCIISPLELLFDHPLTGPRLSHKGVMLFCVM